MIYTVVTESVTRVKVFKTSDQRASVFWNHRKGCHTTYVSPKRSFQYISVTTEAVSRVLMLDARKVMNWYFYFFRKLHLIRE